MNIDSVLKLIEEEFSPDAGDGIPEFLLVKNRKPLTPEQQAKLDALKPKKPEMTESERERRAEKLRKENERANQLYELRQKFDALPPEEKALRKATAKLRKARRK